MKDREISIWADRAIVFFSVASLIYFAFRISRTALLPFILSLVLSLIIVPIAEKLEKKTHKTRKLWAVLLLVLSLLLVSLICVYAVDRLIYEIENLGKNLIADKDKISEFFNSFNKKIEELGDRLPFIEALEGIEGLEGVVGNAGELITDAIVGEIGAIAQRLPGHALKLAMSLPEAIVFIFAFILSAFYFCIDSERIERTAVSLIPEDKREGALRIRQRMGEAALSFVRAYLLIMLITFSELFAGLSIMRVKYAFLLSLVIAVVDILPVLGSGTFLIPWAVISFATHDIGRGTGLLILYGIMTIVRQLIEPKIVGNSIGVHPLATLISMYAGLKLFGFIGLVGAPAIVLLIKSLNSKGEERGDLKV